MQAEKADKLEGKGRQALPVLRVPPVLMSHAPVGGIPVGRQAESPNADKEEQDNSVQIKQFVFQDIGNEHHRRGDAPVRIVNGDVRV